MALIKCPECGKEVSGKAGKCIHCGFPFHKAQVEQVEEEYFSFCHVCKAAYSIVFLLVALAVILCFLMEDGIIAAIPLGIWAIVDYLDLKSRAIILSNKAVYIRRGVINVQKANIPLSQVSSITSDTGSFGLFFNYNTITITCSDRTYRMKIMENADELKSAFVKIRGGMDWRTF